MRRSILIVLLILTSTLGLEAQRTGSFKKTSKYDKKLEKIVNDVNDGDKKTKVPDHVRVIIQTRNKASLQDRLSKIIKVNKNYSDPNGLAVEIHSKDLEKLMDDPDVDVISTDEDVVSDATIDGAEPANSSSGALTALNRFGANGSGIGVAIIDSGIANVSFKDLDNVVYSVDFINNTTGKHTDGFGHGTHVAGIVGGGGDASGPARPYAGVAPGVRLIDLRVLDNKGHGITSDVIEAINWAIANRNARGTDGKPLNIRIINVSLGHLPLEGADTDPLAVACRKAVKAGIIVVAAAGNYGKDADGNSVRGAIATPGIEPSVITVGAVTTWGTPSRSDDVIASYSSTGPTIDGIIKPDLVAPGSRIISVMAPKNSLVDDNPQLQIGSSYMMLSGTSMAAPEVAGVAAMILSKVPSLTPNAVKAILQYTAEKRGSPLDWGAGYLNDLGAMELATSINPYAPVGTPWLNSWSRPAYDSINGYGFVWGQTIVWDDEAFTGNSLNFNKLAWGLTIVWGETIVWEADATTIVWGETIVWETDATVELKNLTAQTIVWDLTIVWETDATTIVWAENSVDPDDQ